jgi:hypothetical protein
MKIKLFTALVASAVLLSQQVTAAGAQHQAPAPQHKEPLKMAAKELDISIVTDNAVQDLITSCQKNHEWKKYYHSSINPGYLGALYGITSQDGEKDAYSTALAILLLGKGLGAVNLKEVSQKNPETYAVAVMAAFLAGMHKEYTPKVTLKAIDSPQYQTLSKPIIKFMTLGAKFQKSKKADIKKELNNPKDPAYKELMSAIQPLATAHKEEVMNLIDMYLELVVKN